MSGLDIKTKTEGKPRLLMVNLTCFTDNGSFDAFVRVQVLKGGGADKTCQVLCSAG
jgi:hypothetical protein